jgi:hypothetical protein
MSTPEENIKTILADWLDALRRHDFATVEQRMDPQVFWQGVREDFICENRDEAMEMLREQQREEHGVEALELIATEEKVVLGVRSTQLQEIGGVPLGGRVLRGGFVPERPQRELRELNRYRSTLVRERSAEVGRLQKTLEGANIKLASVATDIMGKSARQVLKALIDGSTDTFAMAQLATGNKGKLRAKIPQLEQALQGCSGAHQRLLVAQQLAHTSTSSRRASSG